MYHCFMDLEIDVDNLTVRELGRLIELAGDTLYDHEEASNSMKALGDMSAEIGHRVVASDGSRLDY